MKRAMEVLCILVLAALVAMPLLQVLMRDLIGTAIIGAEELTRFLLICLVFLSYPLVVDSGENIVMKELRSLIPGQAGRLLKLLIAISSILTCGLMSWVAFESISVNMNNATPTLKIPFWVFFGAALFGFGLAALAHLRQSLKEIFTSKDENR